MEELAKEYPIGQLCQVLEVARSGYYRWRQGATTAREATNAQLVEEINSVYQDKQESTAALGLPRNCVGRATNVIISEWSD